MKDTKTKILDVAQAMMMEQGTEKVSLRKITRAAGVNIAAINYHFGSKNNMVSAIIVRLLNPFLQELDASLRSVMEEAQNQKPDLEAIIRVHLLAMLEFSRQNPDHESMFERLFHFYDDEDSFHQSIRTLVGKVTRYFGDCLVKALPEIPQQVVLARAAFFRNTSMGIMQGNCCMEESLALLGFDMDYDEMVEAMVVYSAAGFRAGY